VLVLEEDARTTIWALAAAMALAGTVPPAPLWAADHIYAFTDEKGVAHFTNVPADPRYKPYTGAAMESPSLAPGRPRPAPPADDVQAHSVASPGEYRGSEDLQSDSPEYADPDSDTSGR